MELSWSRERSNPNITIDTLIHNVQKINNTVKYTRMDHIAHNSMLFALEKKELYEWITALS